MHLNGFSPVFMVRVSGQAILSNHMRRSLKAILLPSHALLFYSPLFLQVRCNTILYKTTVIDYGLTYVYQPRMHFHKDLSSLCVIAK